MERGFLEKCLKSIIYQDYPRESYEVIVSDSGSTDGTLEIADRYAVKVVASERRGIAHGRNVGAKAASGDTLVFVDADVFLRRDFLKRIERNIKKGYAGIGSIGVPYDGGFFPRAVFNLTYLISRITDIIGMPAYPGMAVAYERKTFEKLGGFREDLGISEDIDMSRRVSRAGRCKIDSEAVCYVSTRRLHKNLFFMTVFHLYNDIRYYFTGKSAPRYPKNDELKGWNDVLK
ncbi:MAG: glycosyltransferase [Candidatus Aenigmarchaeota archaeon]|nr:glycosyltransferase [Candidatus Aenigmarchaeota archaeon]